MELHGCSGKDRCAEELKCGSSACNCHAEGGTEGDTGAAAGLVQAVMAGEVGSLPGKGKFLAPAAS